MRPIRPSTTIQISNKKEDKRSQRLIQMRARQQALRQKRADASSDLENLQSIVSDVAFRTHKLTNRQMQLILDLVPFKIDDDQLVDLRKFTSKRISKDEEFITKVENMLVEICKKITHCYHLFLNLKEETPIPNNSLCHISVYGPTFLSPYVNHLKLVSQGKYVPKDWLEFDLLPPGTMNILEALVYIQENLDLNRTNLDLFMLLIGKNIRATPYGPVFTQKALAAAIETSYNPKLDADFFLDSLGTEFCLLQEGSRSEMVRVTWGMETVST